MNENCCELCGKDVGKKWTGMSALHGHHWRGYEYPDDLWYICQSCNLRLSHKHDGSLTLEQAREYVAESRRRSRLPRQVTIDLDQMARLADIAKERGMNVGEVARFLINLGFEVYESSATPSTQPA